MLCAGGASGYGAGIAKQFAQEGAKVCIADNNVAGAEKLAQDTTGISVHRMDVTARKDWHDLGRRILREHGQVDCLINNAGTTHHHKVSVTVEKTLLDFTNVFGG